VSRWALISTRRLHSRWSQYIVSAAGIRSVIISSSSGDGIFVFGKLWRLDAHGQSPTGKDVVEFLTWLSRRPQWIIAGPDDSLWFTEAEGGKIGRITPSGVLAEFPILGRGFSARHHRGL
jgi:hypothetical protein